MHQSKILHHKRISSVTPSTAAVSRTHEHQWSETSHCQGDYFQPVTRASPSSTGAGSGSKAALQRRRNSTSFSTAALDSDGGAAHAVITASALLDLRTSIRPPVR